MDALVACGKPPWWAALPKLIRSSPGRSVASGAAVSSAGRDGADGSFCCADMGSSSMPLRMSAHMSSQRAERLSWAGVAETSAELVCGLLLSCWLVELEARLATLPDALSSVQQLVDGAELASASDAPSAGHEWLVGKCHGGEAAVLAAGETHIVGDNMGGEAANDARSWCPDIAAAGAKRRDGM